MPRSGERSEIRLRAYFASELDDAARGVPEPPLLAARPREPRPGLSLAPRGDRAARGSGAADAVANLAMAACLAIAVGAAFSGRAARPLSLRVDEALASGRLEELGRDASAYASWVLSIGLADATRADRIPR